MKEKNYKEPWKSNPSLVCIVIVIVILFELNGAQYAADVAIALAVVYLHCHSPHTHTLIACCGECKRTNKPNQTSQQANKIIYAHDSVRICAGTYLR